MSTKELPFSEGDTLVNDDGTVTVGIESIDGDTVHVDDSRPYSDGEHSLDEVMQYVEDGHYTVVSDSDLTEIKGIGSATAPKVQAMTGCETPSELTEAYLLDRKTNVVDAVPRTDYFNEWVVEHFEDLDVDVTMVELQAFMFVKEFGGNPKFPAFDDPSTRGRSGRFTSTPMKVDKGAFTVNDLDWSEGAMIPDEANVAAITYDESAFEEVGFDGYRDELGPCDTFERDGDHFKFENGGKTTWVSGDYMETFIEDFGVDPSKAECHPEGEHPVIIQHTTGNWFMLAPRVHDH